MDHSHNFINLAFAPGQVNSHANVVERLKDDLEECDDESHKCAAGTTSETNWVCPSLRGQQMPLGRSTCHAISGPLSQPSRTQISRRQ